MAWIRMLDEAEVLDRGDRRARIYKACMDPGSDRVDNVLKIHGLAPETMEGHLRLYRSVMHAPGNTSRRERELLAVAVSAFNGCEY